MLLLRRAEQLKYTTDLNQIKPAEIGKAEELTEELGMLALAIDQAGAYIGKEDITIEEYLTLYKKAEEGKKLRQTRGDLSGEHTSSSTTYTLNLEQVAFRDPEAAELIRVCAFLAPEAIPKKIFTENPNIWKGQLAIRLAEPSGFDQLCQEATRYSLVQWEPKKLLLSIHSVVQQVIRDELNEEEQKSYIRKVIEGVNAIFPEEIEIRFGSKDILRTCDRLSSQAGKVLEWTKDQSITILAVGHLMNKLSCYFVLRSRYSEAKNICEKSHEFWKNLSEDLLDTNKRELYLGKANRLNNFAELNHIQGNYRKAKELFDEALDIRRNELNSDNPDYYLFGQSLHNLARLKTDLGDYSEAEKLYQQALKINEKIQTKYLEFLLARSYNDLAKLYFVQARYEDAENNYQKALNKNKEILEKNHPNIASNLDNLGGVYMAQNRYDEAEQNFLEALEIRKDYYRGEDYLAIADSYTSLARLYQTLKDYEKARYYYYQALGIQRKLFEDKDHPDIATSYNNLAVLYKEQGFNEEAEQYYIDVLDKYKKAFSEDHSTVATAYNNLALFYHEQGNYSESEKYYKKSLSIYKKTVNETHPLIAYCLDNLALLYQEQENYEDAESLFKEALKLRRQTPIQK